MESGFGCAESECEIRSCLAHRNGDLQPSDPKKLVPELPNAAVCLRIFIYEGPKMKLCSVCREDRAQSNGPTLRSLANFHIELEQFCCSLTAA